jgi:N-methylhydantoinase A
VRTAECRYTGQNYELEVPWQPAPDALRAAFEARHRQLYGYATGESVEIVNLRVVARVDDVAIGLPRVEPERRSDVAGEQPAWFPGLGDVTLPRRHRAALVPGAVVHGPALVEDAWSTTLVYPGQRCTPDAHGNLVIETGA